MASFVLCGISWIAWPRLEAVDCRLFMTTIFRREFKYVRNGEKSSTEIKWSKNVVLGFQSRKIWSFRKGG